MGVTNVVTTQAGLARSRDAAVAPRSRFLVTCWPFAGHVNPQISIALALRERGHEVAFYTHSDAQAVVEGEGFTLFPFRRVDERHWKDVHAMESQSGKRQQSARIAIRAFRDWLVGSIPGQVADLEPILRSWRPDVLVTDPTMWGPIMVLWEATRTPVAISSFVPACMVPGPEAPPWGLGLRPPRTVSGRVLARLCGLGADLLAAGLRRRVDRIRAAYGLAPTGCSVNAFTGRLPLYLVPTVPELDYSRRDLPASVQYVGPCVWNRPSQSAAPAWLDELPADRPWVHVTEGTSHLQDPFVLRAAVQGLGNRDMEVIVTTGLGRDPSTLDLGPRAPNIRVEQWLSHSDLLPRCAVMVTTGGAGSVMAALQSGVPLVIVPTTWDKPENAQRVVAAGAGLRLSPRQCTPARLRGAIERVLVEPSFRENAQRLARRLAETPGPPRAAELLEALAARSRVAA
jgi:MGT family glycosyltransferase